MCIKIRTARSKKEYNKSNFQLVFTDDSVYDLDKIILLRRDVGNMPSSIHVVEKAEDKYADIMLVFLAIDHLLFNTDTSSTYTYEQTQYYRATTNNYNK